MGTVDLFEFSQESDQGNSLDSLSQTHFIGQYTINTVIVQVDQPVKTINLMGLKKASLEN